MKFARVLTAFDCTNPTIDRLASQFDLDLLQLDYRWPVTDLPSSGARQQYATGFRDQLRTLHKTLYLEPSLKLITNAGGGDTLACIEMLAAYLCEHDDKSLPITAIRGDNVLARLDEMLADGIELRDRRSGTRLQDLTQPILSAQVELGAGPFCTASRDGSRIVVAGCYDFAAPLIATAASLEYATWDATERLAQLAVAARYQEAVITIESSDSFGLNIELRNESRANHGELLDTKNVELGNCRGSQIRHADVQYEEIDNALAGEPHQTIVPPPIEASEPDGNWLLKIAYVSGYVAEANLLFKDPTVAKEALESLQSLTGRSYANADTRLKIHSFQAQRDKSAVPNHLSTTIVRVHYESDQLSPCETLVETIKNYIQQRQRVPALFASQMPIVLARTTEFCCEVPRDVIAVSVDTRPAHEWK